MKKFIIIIFIFGIIFWFLFFWKIFFEKNSQDFYTIPSDTNIFTQGFFVENDEIFLSSWNPEYFKNTKTQFWILENGNFKPKIIINDTNFFWEWSVIWQGKIFWTFWKNQKIFVYNLKNFEKITEISIDGEGWGLTTDGENLILSDGSEFLTFFDENFWIVKKLKITENGEKITKINELEYIDGKIFANIWLTNDIVIIEPKTGEILVRKNFDHLKNVEITENPNAQEMNGIAYNKEKQEILLTGKMWSKIYIFPKKFFEK